jgi:hypothetical protein
VQIRHAIQAGLMGLFAVAGTAVWAQSVPTATPLPHPAAAPPHPGDVEDIVNPLAFVPAVRYRSVFKDIPTGAEMDEVDWKKANAEVGQFQRGHIDILRWESSQKVTP